MANDPNNSGNGNVPNQIGDMGMSRLEAIAAENRPGAQERADRAKARSARKGLDMYETFGEEARASEMIKHIRNRDQKTVNRLEPRIRIAVESRQQRLNAQAINTINREFSESSINGQVSELVNSPEAQQGAIGMMSVPYSDLVSQQRQREARLQELGTANRAMASRVIGRKGINQDVYGSMQVNTKEAQGLINELGTIGAALGQQKSLGLDPKNRISDLFSKGAQASAIVNNADMSRSIASGEGKYGGKSSAEIKNMEVEAATALVKALEALKGATDETRESLHKTAESAATNLGEVQSAIAAGAGGGGRNFNQYAQLASSGFGAAASAIQAIGVNQRLGQAQNAAGYAGFENQKYQTYKAAAGGDIASLLQLSNFDAAEGFGGELKTAANVAVGAQVASGVAQIAAGATQEGSTLNPLNSAFNTSSAAKALKEGATDIMSGTATIAVGGSDLLRGVSGGQADIAGRNARMEVSRAINAVGAEQLQGFRDYNVGLGAATIGMGGAGEAFLQRMNDVNNNSVQVPMLQRMASARISPEQMTMMAQQGVANMGSMFNENQIFAARGAESRGFGSMQENMQRMAGLASAGSNNPQSSLASVMEVALTRGLDSSKALNAVVDHTATMAASSTGRAYGMDTTAAASALVTAGITQNTPNKEAALERNASIQDKLNSIGTNTNVNYAGMVNTARIGRTTGLDGVSSIIAGGIDDATLMSLGAGSGAQLQRMCVDVRGKNVGTLVSQLKEDRQMQFLETGNLSINFNRADALKRINSGTALTADEQLGIDQSARLQGLTGDELISRTRAIKQGIDPNAPTGNKALGAVDNDDKSLRGSIDRMRTMGFEQLTQAASTAAQNLGGAAKAIGTLTTAFENLEKAMPNIEKSATTAAGRAAAGGKGLNVDGFNVAIDKLDAVLNAALKKSGLGANTSSTSDTRQKTMPPGP